MVSQVRCPSRFSSSWHPISKTSGFVGRTCPRRLSWRQPIRAPNEPQPAEIPAPANPYKLRNPQLLLLNPRQNSPYLRSWQNDASQEKPQNWPGGGMTIFYLATPPGLSQNATVLIKWHPASVGPGRFRPLDGTCQKPVIFSKSQWHQIRWGPAFSRPVRAESPDPLEGTSVAPSSLMMGRENPC